MATRLKSVNHLQTFGDHVDIVTWSGLLNGDDGEPYENPGAADRSIQIQGTPGAGGTIVLEGSNNGVNYVTLTDPQGNALSFTAADRIEAISELTRFVRPRVTAGDGTTTLVATLLAKRGGFA